MLLFYDSTRKVEMLSSFKIQYLSSLLPCTVYFSLLYLWYMPFSIFLNYLFCTAGEALSRVDYDATSATVMRENVERVLQFMASKRIRMHHTSAKG